MVVLRRLRRFFASNFVQLSQSPPNRSAARASERRELRRLHACWCWRILRLSNRGGVGANAADERAIPATPPTTPCWMHSCCYCCWRHLSLLLMGDDSYCGARMTSSRRRPLAATAGRALLSLPSRLLAAQQLDAGAEGGECGAARGAANMALMEAPRTTCRNSIQTDGRKQQTTREGRTQAGQQAARSPSLSPRVLLLRRLCLLLSRALVHHAFRS